MLDWFDRRVILEAGLAIDTAGRRVSGTEPREIDQGQHDGDRDVLAVSSAGMLARRDVWDTVGGFDPELALFRDDVDFCWRVHAAGYRVRLITGAVVYHVEASARGRRAISAVPHPKRSDRRNALIVLLGNLPVTAMIAAAVGNAVLSTARILFFLLGKRPEAARDEAAAAGFLLTHPGLLYRARRRRRWRGRRRAYGALRSQVPRGQSLRKLAEFAALTLYPSSRAEAVGSHHASDDPSDDESLLTDSGLVQRVLTNPGVLLFTALLLITLVAERSLLGGGPLGGGALLPSWGGASALWSEYLAGFHPVGIGSAASTPPYIAVIAAVSTILGGKPWLAVELILLGCVPLSGLAAYLTSRRFSEYVPVRVWLAVSYALLPVATGAVAAGRLGTAVVFILMPLIVSTAGRMLGERRRRARRFAWATGLLIALAAAFVPLVWVVTVLIAAFAGLAFARARRALAINLAIVAVVPPILLAPWTLSVAEHPSALLLEAGLQQPGLASRSLPASSLLLLSPGGPGTPPVWVTAGLVLAALAALLLRGRGFGVAAAWGLGLSGLLVAIAISRFVVTPPAGGAAVPVWPGVALIFAALGLLLAVAAAGKDLYALIAAGGLRRIGAGVMIAAACTPPVLAAGFWMAHGVTGPVTRISQPVLPQFVSVSSASGAQLRTLVLRTDGHGVDYTVLRGSDPPLGSSELTEPAPAARALQRVVAALAAPNGNQTGNLGASLAQFDIGFVLLPAPVSRALASQINDVADLSLLSQTPTFELWKIQGTVARATVTEPDGTQVALPSGGVSVTGAAAPPSGGTIELAEPASGSWHATLDGRPLTPLPQPVGGWAQGFRLPPGGGTLDIRRDDSGRTLAIALEFLVLLVVAALALPGAKEEAPVAEEAATTPARPRRSSGQGPAGRAATAVRSRRAGGTSRVDRPADVDSGEEPSRAGRRGVRGRDQRPAGPRRGTRGTRTPGRRRRTGADGAETSGPHRVPAAAHRRPQPGPHQDEHDSYQGQRDPYQGGPGLYQDEPGLYEDEAGPYQGERSPYQGEPGPYQDEPGPYQDEPGSYQGQRDPYQDQRGSYTGEWDGQEQRSPGHGDWAGEGWPPGGQMGPPPEGDRPGAGWPPGEHLEPLPDQDDGYGAGWPPDGRMSQPPGDNDGGYDAQWPPDGSYSQAWDGDR